MTITSADLTDPASSAAAPRVRRTPLRVTTKLSTDNYGATYQTEQRSVARYLLEANLISSALGNGLHAPCFDLDMPTVLTASPDGELTCWVDAPLRRRAYAKFVSTGQIARLFRPSDLSRKATSLAARQAAYANAATATVDTSARDARLRTRPRQGTTLEGVIAQASAVTPPAQITGPAMANPWPLPLATPASLVPSTHNYHLYLDIEVTWDFYTGFLKRAKRARLLQPGYVGASIRRSGTHLRLPWIAKDANGD